MVATRLLNLAPVTYNTLVTQAHHSNILPSSLSPNLDLDRTLTELRRNDRTPVSLWCTQVGRGKRSYLMDLLEVSTNKTA